MRNFKDKMIFRVIDKFSLIVFTFSNKVSLNISIFFYDKIILLLSINNLYLNVDEDHIVRKEFSR